MNWAYWLIIGMFIGWLATCLSYGDKYPNRDNHQQKTENTSAQPKTKATRAKGKNETRQKDDG